LTGKKKIELNATTATLVTQPDQRATVRQFPPRFPMHKFWVGIARNCHLAESSSQSVKNGCPWQKFRPRESHLLVG